MGEWRKIIIITLWYLDNFYVLGQIDPKNVYLQTKCTLEYYPH